MNIRQLARAQGVWLEPDIAKPATAEGHASSPPHKGQGQPSKSPDNPRVSAAPAHASKHQR